MKTIKKTRILNRAISFINQFVKEDTGLKEHIISELNEIKNTSQEEEIDWKVFKTCFFDYYSLGQKTREELYEWIKNFLT
jgi:hypothetical protein